MDIAIQIATTYKPVPTRALLRDAAKAALTHLNKPGALCIRVVGEREAKKLNQTYRHKDYVPNVLSFEGDGDYWGDIVICAAVVAREATEQSKLYEAHFVHMVVHGVLHLLGYDHIAPDEAQVMEKLECQILVGLGITNPYE